MKTALFAMATLVAAGLASAAGTDCAADRTPEAAAVLKNLRELPEKGRFVYSWCLPWKSDSPEYRKETPEGPKPRAPGEFALAGGFFPDIGRNPILYFTDLNLVTDITKSEKRIREMRASLTAMVRKAWADYRAVPVFSWHPENPYFVTVKDWRKLWYVECPYRFRYVDKRYPQEHRYVIHEILSEDGYARRWFDSSLATIAAFLSDLKDEKGVRIPAVVRLFHECEDDWPWWGRGSVTAADYKAIFRLTVRRLRELTGGGAQLLFAYSPDRFWSTLGKVDSPNDFLYRYPGDDVVDIVGHDDYSLGEGKTPEAADRIQEASLGQIRKVSAFAAAHGKAAGLFECAVRGPVGEKTKRDDTYDRFFRVMTSPGVKYGFINTWSGHYSKPYTEAGMDCWRRFVARPEVLTHESGADLTREGL